MAARVGIPRGLGYYYLYPFYKTFLEQLGAEVIVSPPTTKATLDSMEVCPTDEPCVAVKLYFAHTEALKAVGADYIWNPVLASMGKDNFCCPKFLGISDMVRNGLHLDASSLLMPRFDCQKKPAQADKPFFDVAAELGITDKARVRRSLEAAWSVQEEYESLMVSEQLTIAEAYKVLDGGKKPKEHAPVLQDGERQQNIGVIGHPYILYDMLSHNMIDRLREFGSVITAEMVKSDDAELAVNGITDGHKLWSFEARMLGAALHLLKNRSIDKIILVGSFECGPESVIETYVEQEAEAQGIPFLLLTIDEQTGEAGLVTRIEAFMDTASARATEHSSKPSPDAGIKHGVYTGTETEMIVGFPSMGYLDVAIRSMLEDCGTKCIKSPGTSKRSIQLGSELAPEFVCFPFTATLGQMRELLEMGANTLFMVGGKGRCRLGWYAQVQEEILRRAGYDFEMCVLDSPVPFRPNWKPFSELLKYLTHNASWSKILSSIYFGYMKIAALDSAETVCHKLRAVERERGAADKLFSRYERRIEHASDTSTVKRATREFKEAVSAIEIEDTDPIRVRIVGEIWVVLEHFVNQEIEKILASQESIRVEVDRELSATHWFRQNVLSDPALKSRERQIIHAATRFLTEEVGGHGQESIGATVLAHEEGCDGVVHIFPFTCMPEIVAQNILVEVSDVLDIPVLTYIISEQMGEAGIQTRIEAFLDVLEERRRYRRAAENHGSLEWHTT